jgi:hypothetical protein
MPPPQLHSSPTGAQREKCNRSVTMASRMENRPGWSFPLHQSYTFRALVLNG